MSVVSKRSVWLWNHSERLSWYLRSVHSIQHTYYHDVYVPNAKACHNCGYHTILPAKHTHRHSRYNVHRGILPARITDSEILPAKKTCRDFGTRKFCRQNFTESCREKKTPDAVAANIYSLTHPWTSYAYTSQHISCLNNLLKHFDLDEIASIVTYFMVNSICQWTSVTLRNTSHVQTTCSSFLMLMK